MTATTTATATTGTILALDLGKFKSVACVYDRDDVDRPCFESVTTSRQHLGRLIAKDTPALVVIKACLLAGWVQDLCAELGLPCKVANTASEAWKFKHQKRKTDKDDALRLAELEALGQLPTVVLASTTQTSAGGRQRHRSPPTAGRPPRGRPEPHPGDPCRARSLHPAPLADARPPGP